MSEYEWQVKLAAKGLAERAKRPIPAMTDEAFYEIMAAAALDAIDLPALLKRVTGAERELEIIQEALRRADTEAKNARHKPMIDGEDSEESSLAAILRGASTSRGPMRTDNLCPSPLPRDPEHSDPVDERRRLSAVSPPINRSGKTGPPPPPRKPPNRTARGSRRALVNFFHSLSWRKLLPLRSSPAEGRQKTDPQLSRARTSRYGGGLPIVENPVPSARESHRHPEAWGKERTRWRPAAE